MGVEHYQYMHAALVVDNDVSETTSVKKREGAMFVRKVMLAVGFSLLVLVPSALAQTTTYVCWAEDKSMCGGPFGNAAAVHYPCDSISPPGGFNPPYVCHSLCGVPPGPGCQIFAGPGGAGGQCGFRGARIWCAQ
jgi:hypothetical protein